MSYRKQRILLLVGILVLAVALPITSYFVTARDSFDSRGEASTQYSCLTSSGRFYGDAIGNGLITRADQELVMEAALEKVTLDPVSREAADVNGDGDINVFDVVLIGRYVLNLIDTFPVCPPQVDIEDPIIVTPEPTPEPIVIDEDEDSEDTSSVPDLIEVCSRSNVNNPNIDCGTGEVCNYDGKCYIGDLTGNGKITFGDYSVFSGDWRTFNDEAIYNPRSDLNHDGRIDILDYAIFRTSWLATREIRDAEWW